MNEITSAIVSFLFLPVTIFIIIPLVMLCCWLIFKMFMRLKLSLTKTKESAEKEIIHT